jgi:hypothetical protein
VLLPSVFTHSWVATIGAVVTIAALGIDTFAQQVVHFPLVDTKVLSDSIQFALCRMYNSSAKFEEQTTVKIDNQRHHCTPWKSSSIAILKHNVAFREGTEPSVEVYHSDISSLEEMMRWRHELWSN